MAKITVAYGEVIVEIEGIDHLWALRSQLEIPLAHVRGAGRDPALAQRCQPPHQAVPVRGAMSGGSLLRWGEIVTWELHDPEKAVVIELEDERCAQLVVEVDDPADAVARINRALAARRCGDG